jgi:hypothetical protein
VQLQEHARAILADDERLGIRRKDPVLQRLAKNTPAHADAWHITLTASISVIFCFLTLFVCFFLPFFASLGRK